MTGSGKNDSKTSPTRKPGKAKPAGSRTAKSSSSGRARASRRLHRRAGQRRGVRGERHATPPHRRAGQRRRRAIPSG